MIYSLFAHFNTIEDKDRFKVGIKNTDHTDHLFKIDVGQIFVNFSGGGQKNLWPLRPPPECVNSKFKYSLKENVEITGRTCYGDHVQYTGTT